VSNTVDFSAQINDIRGFNPDVIYYSGFCPEGAPLMIQLQQQGFDQPKLGADASDDPQCIEGGGAAFDGHRFTGFGGAEVLSGEAAERATDFRAFYDVVFPDGDFNGFTLAGADSLNVIAEAIATADSTSVADVRNALASLEGYAGVSGTITYAGTDGTPANRTIAFFEYDFDLGSTYGEVKTSLFGLQTGE